MITVPLILSVVDGSARHGEPVTLGLPWARGQVFDTGQFRHLCGNEEKPLQAEVLDRWGDGSIRWCLFDFRADSGPNSPGHAIAVGEKRPVPTAEPHPLAQQFRLILQEGISIVGVDSAIQLNGWTWGQLQPGRLRQRQTFSASTNIGLELFGSLDLFPGLSTARIELTIRNPKPADHPGGTWDLGNGGSITLKRFGFTLKSGPESGKIHLSLDATTPPVEATNELKLHQESSGGENWNCINHIDRHRKVPLDYRGYRGNLDGKALEGFRASPIVWRESPQNFQLLCLPDFWQNFPKAIHADSKELNLDFFPECNQQVMELQGGEQKSHSFFVSLSQDAVSELPGAWCRNPIACQAAPEWYSATGVVPHLIPTSQWNEPRYSHFVNEALQGSNSFRAKRELIDQYGWRHYGDVYADHESIGYKWDQQFISHYNNQYDVVYAFLIHGLMSGNTQWHDYAQACASHTVDIDIYHTTGDKAAYNNGLFWHTYHYAPADTSNHRAYPARLQKGSVASQTERVDQLGDTGKTLIKAYATGGGPSASHCYATGLLHAFYLTGNPRYRDAVVGLSEFIIAMEDPKKTVFRFLSLEETGLATDSQSGYHGPGRASGNAINTLLDGFRLTGDRRFLLFAEKLIRRVTSPTQDLNQLNLLNAELRWFYTMHLQAVGKYLTVKTDLGENDEMYAYASATILHYSEWMLQHERNILDHPEKLQYPTETWAAQDLRKVECLEIAAELSDSPKREKYLERAERFYQDALNKLGAFSTSTTTRPLILLLRYGWSRLNWRNSPSSSFSFPKALKTPPAQKWTMFVPQKVIAIKRAKLLTVTGAGVVFLTTVVGIIWLLR